MTLLKKKLLLFLIVVACTVWILSYFSVHLYPYNGFQFAEILFYFLLCGALDCSTAVGKRFVFWSVALPLSAILWLIPPVLAIIIFWKKGLFRKE